MVLKHTGASAALSTAAAVLSAAAGEAASKSGEGEGEATNTYKQEARFNSSK